MPGQSTAPPCLICGQPIKLPKYRDKRRNPRYCSQRCNGAAHKLWNTRQESARIRARQRAKREPAPSLPGEEWRAVIGFEGFYEVSNIGRVRNVSFRNGTWPGRLLKLNNDGTGYHRVVLAPGDRPKRPESVHRLVAAAFIRPPLAGEHVNHIDGVKTNNIPANLEWVLPAENLRHARRIGLNTGLKKLTLEQVREIRQLRGIVSGVELARRYGVSSAMISYIQRPTSAS
jgi:hypothetical protein